MLNGFFEPLRSRTHALAIADIHEIGGRIKRTTGDEYHIIRMRGDIGQVEAYPSEVECLLRRPMQLIPAAGALLYANADGDGAYVIRTPLIAWALCMDGLIRPVTPSGVDDGDMTPPFGWFFDAGEGIHSCGDTGRENMFATEDELKAAVARWKESDEAHRAAMAKGGDA